MNVAERGDTHIVVLETKYIKDTIESVKSRYLVVQGVVPDSKLKAQGAG